MKSTDLRAALISRRAEKALLEKQLAETRIKARDAKRDLRRQEQALEIVKEVGIKTQQQLQYHIGDITSMALDAVLVENPYELTAEFVQRRNKNECDLLFQRGGNTYDPLDASGGGAADVAAFALRIASWSMGNPKTRATIIMDEPLRFLSQDKQDRASAMIKELSKKLNLQFIIVTHEDTLTQYADRVFSVSQHRGVSRVKTTDV